MKDTVEDLLKLKDYIENLNDSVGLSPETYKDITNAIEKKRAEINRCSISIDTPRAEVKFILWHIETKKEIEMPVLGICEEYSNITFGAKYNTDSDDTLPSGVSDSTANEYDVFIEINGVRHLYDGLFYNSDETETKREHYS